MRLLPRTPSMLASMLAADVVFARMLTTNRVSSRLLRDDLREAAACRMLASYAFSERASRCLAGAGERVLANEFEAYGCDSRAS